MLQSQVNKIGECEVCDNKDIEISCHYGNMWFCEDCWSKESEFNKSQEGQKVRIEAFQSSIESKVIETSRAIDNSIQVRTDLFNAATVAIVDLKKSIDDNPAITNKPYALAEELTTRFKHFQKVAFELNQQLVEVGNQQKAIQVYLNQMSNSLRQEEREKLKIADINYKPTSKPVVKRVSTSQTKKKTKLDKVELRKYAAEFNVSEFTLQTIAVGKNLTLAETAEYFRKLKAEAASQ